MSDTGRLLVVPADPRIEASCRYARAADERELIARTEKQMLGDTVWTGVDFALDGAPSYSLVHTWTKTHVPLASGDVLTHKVTVTISE